MKSETEYWNKHWEETKFSPAPNNHPIRKWIEKEIPNTKTLTCIEIGCYPGKFLSVFGEMGYELNGIDSFTKVDNLQEYFKSKGYRYKNFYKKDFLTFSSETKYDLVSSFGFIEHFNNWEEVIDKHLNLLKNGGKIVIDVPNLNSPIYYFLYKLFEPEVIKNHILTAMNLEYIESYLSKNGCKIDYSNYVGHFYFRFVTKHDKIHEVVSKVINFFGPIFELFHPRLYKRYIGIIATKNI